MSGHAQGWGGGYVTDIDYLPGWYPPQSPMHLAIACLLQDVACDLPAGEEPVHYMELGCGLGFGAMVLAASNPGWRITAIDFSPAHIARARAIARDAGLRNITFLEADLATLAEEEEGRRLPRADFVSLHGVWSWVSPEVRAGIVRLLRAKVAPGGVVHITYNALPGWQSALGMQRLLIKAGEAAGGSSAARAMAGLEMVRSLMAAEATHLHGSIIPRKLNDLFEQMPIEYVAHEFMNRHWSPCFHADVAAALADAKLDWIGSASLPENYAALVLSDAQRALLTNVSDPMMRELIKDMCLPRPLRQDVYVRGVQRLSPATRNAALGDVMLALTVPPEDVSFEIDVGASKVTLSAAYYEPILNALRSGPETVADLLTLPPSGSSDPRELLGILVGIGHALPMLRPGMEPDPVAQRFNRIAARWLMAPRHYDKGFALASVAAGGGFPVTVFDMFINDRMQAGEGIESLEQWVRMLLADDPDRDPGPLRMVLSRSVEHRIPLLRVAAVI